LLNWNNGDSQTNGPLSKDREDLRLDARSRRIRIIVGFYLAQSEPVEKGDAEQRGKAALDPALPGPSTVWGTEDPVDRQARI